MACVMGRFVSLATVAFAIFVSVATAAGKPHILFIVADDLGFDDVGFRSHQIDTPHIDGLAKAGVVLDSYYAQDVCSPSRSAFMSGVFPIHNSIDDWIPPGDSYGLPLNFTTMADKAKSAGYDTHAVGKWHLGFYKWAYTPTFRGFNSFLGFYSGGEDYFKHTAGGHYDLRFDESPNCGKGCSKVASWANGNYSTTVFTDQAVHIVENHNAEMPLFLYLAYQAVHAPSEVPESYVEPYNNRIKDTHRRTFAGMLSCMDEGIGNVTRALKEKGMLEDTLIVFTSDNGGPTSHTPGGDYVGSRNWPLRGGKHSIWEGGTRVTGLISGAGVDKPGTYTNLMHAVDWLPTLGAVAGYETSDMYLDGVNQWDSIVNSAPAPRTGFVYGRHDDSPNSTIDNAIRDGDWKLIFGTGGLPNDWEPPANMSVPVVPLMSDVTSTAPYMLFNLTDDPTEHNDVAAMFPDVVQRLATKLNETLKGAIPAGKDDPSCSAPTFPTDPVVGTVWEPWC